MDDSLQIIGNPGSGDVVRLRAAFDLNGVHYSFVEAEGNYQTITLAKVNGVSLDFFGWNEPAVKFIVENIELPTTINHEEN